MAGGSWTGTASSAELLAASEDRDSVLIVLSSDVTVAFGLGEDAVAGQGIQLFKTGDSVHLRGAAARKQVNVIGNTATGSYEDDFCGSELVRGPHVPAA